jgi:SAM-dependent methyltransferase
MAIVTSSYDAVPYTSLPYPRTHPDHLHAMARLFGVRAPNVETSRVVELGCGSAGNLLAMAATMPAARFVGIDASIGEIERGRAVVESLGLANLELIAGDAAAPLPGEFDYVIAHGLLSWVPPETRRSILLRALEALSPNGVVYASYNVNPGFQLRAMVRSMLRYHAAEGTPAERIVRSRALLTWLSQRVARDAGAYRAVLDDEQERLAAADDGYLFHEHLEDNNHALWFHELAAEARSLGLQWLAEADPAAPVRALANPRAYASLREVAGDDPIAIEQHFDFLRGRSFRASLLVHAAHRRVETVPQGDLYAASGGSPDVEETEVLRELARAWPDAVAVEELDAAALMPLHAASIVELRARPLHLARFDAESVWTSPFARYQALRSGPVTNLRHEPIPLAEPERQLLMLLDGRTRASLEGALGARFPLGLTLATLARLAFLRDGPP